MSTRQMNRNVSFSVESLYTQFLASVPGWVGGSAEDIDNITWDTTLRTLTVIHEPEVGLTRSITYTAAELYSALLSSLPGWSGLAGTSILSVQYKPGSRQLTFYKVSEAA